MVKKLLKLRVKGRENDESRDKGDQVLVLSPYRAQCHVIRQDLIHEGLTKVNVTSIVKSQGKPG